MKSGRRTLTITLAATAGLALANSANASLILANPTDVSGAGLGSVNTVLTIASPGSSSSETGSVAWNGTTTVVTGDVQAQYGTPTIGTLGISSAQQLRVTFNASEPAGNSITLNNLVLSIYSPSGGTLFSSGAFAPQTFASTLTGVGNAGFVFRLDDAQAAAAQAVFASTNRIGLAATATNATGGLETFYVSQSVTSVPEPGTYGMLLSGIGLMALIARRRRLRS